MIFEIDFEIAVAPGLTNFISVAVLVLQQIIVTSQIFSTFCFSSNIVAPCCAGCPKSSDMMDSGLGNILKVGFSKPCAASCEASCVATAGCSAGRTYPSNSSAGEVEW